jgi:hypothetical protein
MRFKMNKPNRISYKQWIDGREVGLYFNRTSDAFNANEPYIDQLESLLKEACEVIEFYGNGKSWGWGDNSQGKNISFIRGDYNETIKDHYIGGKKERSFIEKNKDALSAKGEINEN